MVCQLYFECCKILGVEPGSDVEQIKSAFRKSAKELHPDLNDSEKAHQYFIILRNAYQYLLNHPYSKEDIENYRQIVYEKTRMRASKTTGTVDFRRIRKNFVERYTLREVLKKSVTARILYVLFHILFLTIGLFLIVFSFHDIFFQEIDDRTNLFSAYFAILSAIVFGIILTSIFLYSGYNFLKRR